MRKTVSTLAIFALVLGLGTTAWAGGVALDEKVPDFTLKDTEAKEHSLFGALKDEDTKAVIVNFWSKDCPISKRYDKRLNGIYEKYKDKGVQVLSIDANYNESLNEISSFAKSKNLGFTILINPDSSVADLYAAETTPHIFLVDDEGLLRYTGSIDNDKDVGEEGRITYLEDAIDQLLAGKTVETKKTRHFGCEIKRR